MPAGPLYFIAIVAVAMLVAGYFGVGQLP
jgi:hypothetical protein